MPERVPGSSISTRSGGRILADALRVHGAERIFCVPGESYIDLLDALYDTPDIQLITAKHEGAAANMAEADGKLTGRPGVCFVTRGPGATQASVGVFTAAHDSTPMILFIGQVSREFRGRGAFQEVEFRDFFRAFAKSVFEIEDPRLVPQTVLEGFQIATSGRPGPVVVSLPEDVLSETCVVADTGRFRAEQPSPKPAEVEAVRAELSRAQRPLLILGGSGWTDAAWAATQKFAEANQLPVAAAFRRQDLFDNEHPCYAGHLGLGMSPQLAARVRAADLIVALGTRLGEVTSGAYTVIQPPRPAQRLVHIHADAKELGRVFEADLAIHASPANFATKLAELAPFANSPWRAWTEESRREFLAFTAPPPGGPPIGVNLAAVVTHLAKRLPPESIVSNGAGNFTIWVHRFYRYRRLHTELAPTSGSMGYGFPAGIAAALRHPERLSVCLSGDGDFLMYAQELATAVQYNARVITLVVNNGMYGTIRMHQERRFPGRVIATDIRNPDFVALARSYGAYGERVESTEAFAGAFECAVESRKPALIEICVDPKQITPDRRLP